MSKWNRWKLINKESGLSFKQHYKTGKRFKNKRGRSTRYSPSSELIPVLLDSGIPAYYNTEQDYPYLEILDPKEWIIIMKPATEL